MFRNVALSLLLGTLLLGIPLVAGAGGVVLEIDVERDITVNGIDAGDLSGLAPVVGDINNDGTVDLISVQLGPIPVAYPIRVRPT